MASKLGIYNLTLGHLRERRLASLSENREPRRVLDDFYDQVVGECLEEGLWNFMIRAVRADHSTTITPGFGWTYAFPLPDDWTRTVMISAAESFNPPLDEYEEEAGYWYANATPLYVRYISSSITYGMDLGSWPATFAAYVALKLAEYACGKITGSTRLLEGPEGIIRRCHKAKVKAKSNDAMNQAPGKPRTGTWVLSRIDGARSRGPNGIGYDD